MSRPPRQFLCWLLLLLAQCVVGGQSIRSASEDVTPEVVADLKLNLVERINEDRRQYGLSSVVFSQALSQLADAVWVKRRGSDDKPFIVTNVSIFVE